eukprot:TRINITY_DN399_c0_g5_i1.p1 TRINITY_DN399_c0_g5~~TRINITY_DN399_c0_g5_i1.p1  ORF type:complete len:337 (-),score=54.42 TRINITY_DN399_c0_g5_i1:174-1064(-)
MANLFTTDAQIAAAVETVRAYKEEDVMPEGGVEALWDAQKVKNSCLHPDTGEKIFLPFRLSCYVPMNFLISAAMLYPGASTATIMFWQWANQSYNVGLNFSNRNASNPVSNQDLAINYGAAVASSIGIVAGFKKLLPKLSFLPPGPRTILNLLVPFFAVAGANFVNVFMMRRDEMQHGIPVKDQDGNTVGVSQKAGMRALAYTSVIRVGCSLPMMTAVPLITHSLGNTKFFQARPGMLKGPVFLGLCWSSLMVGLPLASALFPPQMSVASDKLEERFAQYKTATGEPAMLKYSRGA